MVMKKTGFVLVLLMVFFLGVKSGQSACSYSIILTDDYGDGWNGGLVSVSVNGTEVLSNLTISSGYGPETHYFNVETGDVISTDYTAGGWGYENSYTILDADGNFVAEDGGGGSTPQGLTNILAVCGGTIIVNKQTIPDGATGTFTFSGDAAGSIADGEQIVVNGLDPGTYTSIEAVSFGWELTSMVCDDGNSTVNLGTGTVTFQLEEGETVTCTFTNTELDSDSDGVSDRSEGAGDRDNDGISDYEDYDPTGYFYDEADGRIIPGGLIEVAGPGTVNLIQDGSNGFYQFTTDGTPGIYTVTVTLPPNYEWSQGCVEQGVLDPTGQTNPHVLGSGEDGTTGHLSSNQCTAFYLQFDLEAGDPFIFNNNLSLARSTSIPTLSEWGMIILTLLLSCSFVWINLRQRRYGSRSKV